MSTLPQWRLARRLDVPKDAKTVPPAFAGAWLDSYLTDPDVWDEVMEDFVRATGVYVPDTPSMEDEDFERFVLPRLEWALRSGELVLVETVGAPVERFIRPAGAPQEKGEADEAETYEAEKPKEPPKKKWIEFEVVGMDDKGLPGIRYRAKLPDGSVREGRTSASGLARLDDVDPGNVEFSLPDLDQEAWEEA